jgi:hypothetical protein
MVPRIRQHLRPRVPETILVVCDKDPAAPEQPTRSHWLRNLLRFKRGKKETTTKEAAEDNTNSWDSGSLRTLDSLLRE